MHNKNPTISTLKGLAIILVVYGHVIQRTMGPNGGDFFSNPAFKFIYTFHMPLFVFISGYLMAMSLNRRDVWAVLKIRFRSLFVPFLSWGMLGVLTNYALNAVDGKSSGIYNFPSDVLDQLLVNPVVWFLFTLFVMSGVLLCSVQLEKRFGVLTHAVVYVLLMSIPWNNFCCLYYIKWFYLFYIAGYFVSKYDVKVTNQLVQRILLVISAIIFILFLPNWTTGDYIYINKMNFASDQYGLEILRLIYRYVLGFLGVFVTWRIGAIFAKTKTEPFWAYIGFYSLDIYLIQRYLVEGIFPRVVARLHLNFDFDSPVYLGFFVPVITMLFVGLCILISKLLIRRSSVLNNLLLGNRN